jgi:hypothetical protein
VEVEKIHTPVTVPAVLDMAPFVHPRDRVEEFIGDSSEEATGCLVEAAAAAAAADAPTAAEAVIECAVDDEASKAGRGDGVKPTAEPDLGATADDGALLYDMIGVVYHSGSSYGGHYTADAYV